MSDLEENILDQMVVAKDGPQGTVLHNPKTKVSVTVPKKAGKQGMIQQGDDGELVFDPESDGESEEIIKPGTKVKVQSGGMDNKRSF